MGDMEQPGGAKAMTPEQWAQVRAASEGGESDGSLVKRFGIARNTIKDRRKKEGWGTSENAQKRAADRVADSVRQGSVMQAVRGNVIDMSSRKAWDRVVESGAVDHLANALSKQAEVCSELMDALLHTIRDFRNGDITPSIHQNKADVLNSLANATKNVVGVGRDVGGLRPGIPSTATSSDEGLTIEERVIEPTKLIVDSNGRAIATG